MCLVPVFILSCQSSSQVQEDGKLEMYIYSYAYHSLLTGYLSQLSALHFHWKFQKILIFFIRVDYLSYKSSTRTLLLSFSSS